MPNEHEQQFQFEPLAHITMNSLSLEWHGILWKQSFCCIFAAIKCMSCCVMGYGLISNEIESQIWGYNGTIGTEKNCRFELDLISFHLTIQSLEM